jgi:ribosomal protein S18 acetylase RimI-like enzyme
MNIATLIENLLIDISDDFIPSLSESVNIKDYCTKITLNSTVLSIIREGELIGFVAVYCNDIESRVGYVTMLAVSKKYRTNGIGKQLITLTSEFLKANGFRKIHLEIFKTNIKAISFYKTLGFIIESETEKSIYASKDLIV